MGKKSKNHGEGKSDDSPTEPHFNLLDEPWIPVLWRDRPKGVVPEQSNHTPPRKRRHIDAHRSEIGILDALEYARHIRALADSTPIVNLAVLRFLVTVLYAANLKSDDDAGSWKANLAEYSRVWRERFWLYHPKWPFMQDASKRDKEANKSIATLSHFLAQDTNIAHFAHCMDGVSGLTLPECARALLLQAVAPTNSGRGFKAGINGSPPVYLVPEVGSLSKSLSLHLPYTARTSGDAPCWEGPASHGSMIGYLEGLTWQPRAMLLQEADPQGLVRRLVYDQGKSADAVVSATRAAKVEPARTWGLDPHAIPMKYRSPLVDNPASTTALRVVGALVQHQPWVLRRLSQFEGTVLCQVHYVANDGKAKFFSSDAERIEVPAKVLQQSEHWQPIKKEYRNQLGSVFSVLNQIERLSDSEARRVASEVLASVAGYDNQDTVLMERKVREAFEQERLNTLRQPLASARRVPAPVHGPDALVGLLAGLLGGSASSATGSSRLIESLTTARTFGPTALHRLRTPTDRSLASLVSVTDFLNDELRNKRLLRGRDRRWGWLLVKLYAQHPHHQEGSSNQFGRRLAQLANDRTAEGHVSRQLLQIAACPLELVDTLLSDLVGQLARLRTKDNRPYPVDYISLLGDLMSIEAHRLQVVGRWLWEARGGRKVRAG